jgi:hypothetical protein
MLNRSLAEVASMMSLVSEAQRTNYWSSGLANQNIFCRACGKTKPVTDAELDAEWERNKQSYPGITREQTLNGISFCSECACLSDEVTIKPIRVSTR